MPRLDYDLNKRLIQELANPDAIASFLTRLGYNTNSRVRQTPSNLEITAEGTVSSIQKIELIAAHDFLQVYLFELKRVTIALTRAIARTFKDKAGNFLLILTSDYERLDFVLIEKYLPPVTEAVGSISTRQVRVRPRVLTVERRNPTTIQLRVLRRFTYTELDDYAQYDKLISAFSIAEWSEEYFNNKALFSDYYLLRRLPEFAEWKDDPRQAFMGIRELMLSAGSKYGVRKNEQNLRQQLFEPLFEILGYQWQVGKNAASDSERKPDYYLTNGDNLQPLAVCLTYPWGRYLDGKDELRDTDTPNENPNALVVSLLESSEADWAIVTNGKIWRLYSAKTHSRASNYYEIDLEELIASMGVNEGGAGEAFRYFWLFFRAGALIPHRVEREGLRVELSFLERLLTESEDYAKELGERLKGQVFLSVFPHLAAGFIESIRQTKERKFDLSEELLGQVFQGTLTLLYRLLFLFYAEARDLLPVREIRGYFEASVDKIRKEIAEAAGNIVDQVESNLKKKYKIKEFGLYERLSKLFHMIDAGETSLNVPSYNGGLFITAPDAEDISAEALNARFLAEYKVPDHYLAMALNFLARDLDPKRQDLVFLDYKSLGVRQLGSIYEGLLEFKLRIAAQKLGVKKVKQAEVYVPFAELTDRQKIDAERHGKIVAKGAVYLENNKRERKATGSYYTPDHIVKYIVENAVGPVLENKFDAIRPKLRKAQQAHRAFSERQKALEAQGLKREPEIKAELIGRELVDEIFDIKVLDPAMGSGHFLVEAVDFTTDRILHFLNSFPWNPVLASLEKTRNTILDEMDGQGITIDGKRLTDVNLLKRYVLKRCIYGVDLNPMAVELAKVSLWLDCFTLGAPLSFLDHHLRCGNSLIGVTVKEVREALESAQESLFDTSKFAGLQLATNMMSQVGGLSDVTSSQVKESRHKYGQAVDALAPFKRILDIYTSQWFGNTEAKALSLLRAKEAKPLLDAKKSEKLDKALSAIPKTDREIAETALIVSNEKRFFHWELEFPEVFYGLREGTTQTIERIERAGFDVVIGNPPYDVLAEKELGYDIAYELDYYQSFQTYNSAIRGKKNLYKLFICCGVYVLASNGYFSFIVPMALLGDDQASLVRKMLLDHTSLTAFESFPQKDDPKRRVFEEAKLATTIFVTSKNKIDNMFVVQTHSGKYIEEKPVRIKLMPSQLKLFDPDRLAIPSCDQTDWDIAIGVLGLPKIKRMSKIAESFQGEVNETNERARGALSNSSTNPIALHGSNICLYAVRDASQGEDIFVDLPRFLKGKSTNSKAYDYKFDRIGFQRSSPQNNFRRLIAARLEKNVLCLDTVSYVTSNTCTIDLDLLLAFLNSRFLDWFFRLSSTNSKVNEYQFNALPVLSIDVGKTIVLYDDIKGNLDAVTREIIDEIQEPGCLTVRATNTIVILCKQIQEIEKKRVLARRSERSKLDNKSQKYQDAIDKIIFHAYGLTEQDVDHINRRLSRML